MYEFNEYASPKVETKRFEIYADVSESGLSPEWELQGRGVESWTISENEDITKTVDVLGFVDQERGASQPTQSGVVVKLRKESKFARILFEAWFTKDNHKIDNMQMLQVFRFIQANIDGTTTNYYARLEKGVLISINSFNGEASGYLGFDIDIHYSNDSTVGYATYSEAGDVVFTEGINV